MPLTTPASGGPRQPWLHDLVVATCAPATAVSDASGGMGAPGTGLFVDDRRVLGVLDVRLAGRRPVAISASGRGSRAMFWGSARNLGDAGPDPTVEVRRLRTLLPDGMTERFEVTSRAGVAVVARLDMYAIGDGAEIAVVKGGLADDPESSALPATWSDGVLSWRDERQVTRVTSEPPPASVDTSGRGAHLLYEMVLEPHGSLAVDLEVSTERRITTSFDVVGVTGSWWPGARVTGDDPRLERAAEVSLMDLRSLLLADPSDPSDVFAAAGSPWYLTLFGRDSLWSARFMLPFGTQLAGGTLRALARRQGVRSDVSTAEQPGRILHEVRRMAFEGSAPGLSLPPVYYGTVDATALWLVLLAQAWRHGLPENEVRDLLPAARAAFGWLQATSAAGGDGLLRYLDESGHALVNQGWKDSVDALRRADGTVASGPIALVEAQGYAVQAARLGAAMLSALGEPDAAAWDTYAQDMTRRIRKTFWTGPAPYPAMAVDGNGTLVDGVGSNMGHLLGTGALSRDEAARVVDTLTSPTMLGEYGVSTLARTNPGFNPIGYHTGSVWTHDTAICALGMAREGFTAEASVLLRALIRAASSFEGRWPELYAGDAVLGTPAAYPAACRPQGWSAATIGAVVTVLLGLDVNVPGRTVRLNPARPAPFGAMTVSGLRFGDDEFEVTVDRDGCLTTVVGLPSDVRVVGGQA